MSQSEQVCTAYTGFWGSGLAWNNPDPALPQLALTVRRHHLIDDGPGHEAERSA
eukprot:CAMPEP_0206492732 /NCGR_PEP_ID=MMETSP0324_2-20121206/46347_1 /ASSEMBLY_ACC=CAM_ASM_000836 /TAXON_ID=2866 /ORGANISM="Crypthecodinium cohnii, Strain Seligo" /LENGTH=53 /DNA_ID=CAMNT_0053975331 /DNA_START=107 /DNA_END=264 /DNA_ORIENTATION=-